MQPFPAEAQRRIRSQRMALAVLMGLAFLVVAWMAAPLLVGLALGAVMGFTAQPLHARLAARLSKRRRLAAAVTALLGGLVMAGGGALLVWIVAREIVAASRVVESLVAEGPSLLSGRTGHVLAMIGIPPGDLVDRLRGELGRVGDLAARGAGLLVQTSAGVLLTIVVSLWTMYYVLVDWPRIAGHLERLLPLHPHDTRALVDEFREVGRRVFVGSVATAVVQGVIAGIGFAVFGVPQPMTWGAVLALMSFIPVIGVPLVWVPAAVWLLTAGHVVRALLFTGYCLLFVMALNDYFVRPRLVGREGAHPLLMLVALLGGISVFGIAGIIVGPVVMSLFVASARIYEREREPPP